MPQILVGSLRHATHPLGGYPGRALSELIYQLVPARIAQRPPNSSVYFYEIETLFQEREE